MVNLAFFFLILIIIGFYLLKKNNNIEFFSDRLINISNINTNKKGNNIIPNNIIQTYYSNKINKQIYNNIQKILNKNKDYNYIFITDKDGKKLIKKYFNNKVLNAFNKINIGAAKGDFLRYIALYIYGGVYLDLDSSININLNNFINKNDEYIFLLDNNNNLVQWIIMCNPKNIFIKEIINEMVKRIENNESNIFLATGPTLFNDVIYNSINNTNIYDTNIKINKNNRGVFYLNKNNFKNGKIIKETNKIKKMFNFRFNGYNNELLYNNKKKYKPTWNKPTPNMYK